MKTIIFSLLFLSACTTFNKPVPVAKFEPSVTMAERSISSVGLSPKEIDALWFRVNNDRQDSMIRSNPAHFWAWMTANIPSNLKEVTSYQGLVVADGHYFNFGDVHGDTKNGLALIDVDDSGKGSFFIDFIRYAVFVKAYLKSDYTPQLLSAYQLGLKLDDKLLPVPKYLSDSIDKSRSDLLAENAKWVSKKMVDSNQLNNKMLGLTSFKKLKSLTAEQIKPEPKDAPDAADSNDGDDSDGGSFQVNPKKPKSGSEIVALGTALEEALKKERKVVGIQDHAYMATTSGSSNGLDRFWYSVTWKDGAKRILECKELSDPATGYNAAQKNHAARISDVLKYYSDVATDDSFVFDLTSAGTSYWCRPKHFGFLGRSVEEKRDKTDKMIIYSQYLAYWMGRKQALQKTDSVNRLKSELTDHADQILKDTVLLMNKYDDDINRLGSNGKPKKK